MKKTYWNKIVVILISSLIILFAFNKTLDNRGKALVDDGFLQAVVVFGSAKALNSAISLAQGTEIDLPFLTVAIGEVLDPINDLVEQFSLVMLVSITSLGIQKILINFVTNDIYNYILLFCLIFLNIWLFFRFAKDEKFRTLFFRFTAILIFLRFAVPLTGIANDFTYNNFVKQEYNIVQLNKQIIKAKDDVTMVTNGTLEEKKESSLFSKIREKFDRDYYDQKIEEYKKATDSSSSYIVSLIIAFVFQTILLPLIFLFMLYSIIKSIFGLGR